MKLNDMYPSRYLKASDLKGRQPTVVIASIETELVGQDKQKRWVIYFQGHEKGLVCNKTNAISIGKLYGEDNVEWIGKEITLFSVMVDFQGETRDAIRVKAPVKRAVKPLAKPVEESYGEDDIPL